MNQVIVFDVNETLIDVGALDPFFIGMFGESAARREWFGKCSNPRSSRRLLAPTATSVRWG